MQQQQLNKKYLNSKKSLTNVRLFLCRFCNITRKSCNSDGKKNRDFCGIIFICIFFNKFGETKLKRQMLQ